MNLALDLGIGIVANVIFWLGLGVCIWAFLLLTQARFLGFFGLASSRTLFVYLSNLWQPGSSRASGCVISGHEFRVAETVNSLFGSAPFRLPELVRGLVDSFWTGSKPHVTIDGSPLDTESLVFTNMIVIGASTKNAVRRYYHVVRMLCLVFEGEPEAPPSDVFVKPISPVVRVMKGRDVGKAIGGEYNLAILEKIRDADHGTVAFMCVGYRGDGSWAAAEYLVRHWRDLHQRYGDDPFALCLGFHKSDAYMSGYDEPVELAAYHSA